MNKIVKNIILFGLTAILLAFSLRNLELAELKEEWANTNYWLLFFTSLIAMLSHLSRAERWKLILTPMGYKVNTKNSFYAVMTGYFINLAIPRGGELSRCVSLKKTDNVPVDKSLGTVVAERIVDLIFMLLLIGVTLVVEFKKLTFILSDLYLNVKKALLSISNTSIIILFLSLFLLVALLFSLYKKGKFDSFFQKGRKFLIGLKEGVLSLLKLEKFGLFMLHSLLIWILYFLMTYYGMKSFPSIKHLGLLPSLTVFVASSIAMTIPVPGGTGTYHKIIPPVLLLYTVAEVDGLNFATIFHLWQTLTIILVGSICFVLANINSKNANSESI